MGDTETRLPLGLIYKEYQPTARGTFYYIIQGIETKDNKDTYEQLVTTKFSDTAVSTMLHQSSYILNRLVSEEQGREENFDKGRYPGTFHLPPGKFFLLSQEEFDEFIEYHPDTIRTLREEKGIQELVRRL